MKRTAVEIVRAYGVDAWTHGRDDLIPELCHDPIVRHDANGEVRLSHAEQRARMRHNYEELRPVFEDVVLAGDDEHVTLVWNVTGRDPNWKWCGIEVFRVVDGRIAEVWNSTYMDGRWGQARTLSVRTGSNVTVLPLVRWERQGDPGATGGRLTLPAEPASLAWSLGSLWGRPESTRDGDLWQHRFDAGGRDLDLGLELIEPDGAGLALAQLAVASLTVEWERSGLVNAIVELAGAHGEPTASSPMRVQPFSRLAQIFGEFSRNAAEGQVVEAGITLFPDGGASGRVKLVTDDPAAAQGHGVLRFGWRNGNRHVRFDGTAQLSAPSEVFATDDTYHASYTFAGSDFSATVVDIDPPLDP